jgi:hypothetical protein
VKDLLEAFTIFAKYTDAARPTICAHDTLYVLVDPARVTAEDRERLEALSFIIHWRNNNFFSTRFGSE